MSHSTVTVVTEDPDKLDAMLAPFDENTEVEPYWEPAYDRDRYPTVADMMAYVRSVYEGRADYKIDGGWAKIRARHPSLPERPEDATDEQLMEDWNGGQPYRDGPDGLESQSTYNPRSKWDWYVVGGRWSGYWPVKPAFHGAPELIRGEAGAFNEPVVTPDRADGGPKHMLDLTALEVETAADAQRVIEWVQARKVAELPPLPPEDAGRDAYQAWWRTPAVEALETDNRDSPLGWSAAPRDVHLAATDPEAYLAEKVRVNFPTWALLTPEGWAERGDMGFWGMSDKTPESEERFADIYREIIEHTPDDWYLIVVDVHI